MRNPENGIVLNTHQQPINKKNNNREDEYTGAKSICPTYDTRLAVISNKQEDSEKEVNDSYS